MSESATLIEHLKRLAAGGDCVPGLRAMPRPSDAWRDEGLPRGQLHELLAGSADDGIEDGAVMAASAAGAAVGLALAAGALPLLWLRTEAAERQTGRLQGGGLAEMGVDPAALLLALVADEPALLRAADDAARCTGLGTVLVETWGTAPRLDLTATRRLMLAAEASGVTVLMLRIAGRPTPSAAATRWRVESLPSRPLDADADADIGAPGHPAFALECLRRRGGPHGQRWCVEWNRDRQCFAPLSGADLSLVADRAAALDPASPVRRTG